MLADLLLSVKGHDFTAYHLTGLFRGLAVRHFAASSGMYLSTRLNSSAPWSTGKSSLLCRSLTVDPSSLASLGELPIAL